MREALNKNGVQMTAGAYGQARYPPDVAGDVSTIKSLTSVAGILALVIGIINIVWGAALLIVFIGVIGIGLGIVDTWIFLECRKIERLIEDGKLREAKDATLITLILGFILSWIVVGILLLIAYVKYDSVILRLEQYGHDRGTPPAGSPY